MSWDPGKIKNWIMLSILVIGGIWGGFKLIAEFGTHPARLDAQEAAQVDTEMVQQQTNKTLRSIDAGLVEDRCYRKGKTDEVCEAEQDSIEAEWAKQDSAFNAEMAERLKKK